MTTTSTKQHPQQEAKGLRRLQSLQAMAGMGLLGSTVKIACSLLLNTHFSYLNKTMIFYFFCARLYLHFCFQHCTLQVLPIKPMLDFQDTPPRQSCQSWFLKHARLAWMLECETSRGPQCSDTGNS